MQVNHDFSKIIVQLLVGINNSNRSKQITNTSYAYKFIPKNDLKILISMYKKTNMSAFWKIICSEHN